MFERTGEALQAKVAHWYQELLGWDVPLDRLKSDPGVIYWAGLLAKGQTDNAVLARILSAGDFRAAHGPSNEGLVAALYQTLLGRAPDASGFGYFVGLLEGGMS